VKRESKEKIVEDLGKIFDANGTYYLVDFKRMRVSQSVELRKALRKSSYSYKVVKNRLALRALRNRAPEPLKPFFRKTTAIAFAEKDPIGLARMLRDFSVGGKVLSVKAGIVEGRYMAPERFDEIVRLGSREELLGKVGYMMAHPLGQFLRTLQAPLVDMGRLWSLLKDKK
jgi:large subunit ribosomal protein L10